MVDDFGKQPKIIHYPGRSINIFSDKYIQSVLLLSYLTIFLIRKIFFEIIIVMK